MHRCENPILKSRARSDRRAVLHAYREALIVVTNTSANTFSHFCLKKRLRRIHGTLRHSERRFNRRCGR